MAVLFEFIQGPIYNYEENFRVKDLNLQTGAIAVFKGQVRNDIIKGEEVESIDFSANEPLAKKNCLDLLESALDKYKLINACVLHSLGIVSAGELCFVVLVEASHRKEAFAALPEIVEEFKTTVPVFGKEILKNGTYVWKENR